MVETRENIKGLTVDELKAKMVEMGQPAFKGHQLFRWIYCEKVYDFDQMTDIKKSFREELKKKFYFPTLTVAVKQVSSDGTIKYLSQLEDGEKVESVFIPTEGRNTLCISTQVGCKMGCTFCATSYMGFKRNLKSWEIVEQLIGLDFPEPVTNIVLMGMGEPLDNYEEVKRALEIFQSPVGAKIGKKHITLSTVGLTHKISRFVEDNLGNLAISLHGTTDEQRAKIMPVNKRFPIQNLMDTCRDLKFKNRRRVTFEYLLIRDFNDSDVDAARLAKLVSQIPCKINLLAYNENPFIDFKRPEEARVLGFQAVLLKKGLTTTYRRSRGRDIAAACGQLRTAEQKKKSIRSSPDLPLPQESRAQV